MSADVSVVIASRDRAHVLREALEALLAQDRPELEIIVVDDGSIDETATVVASLPVRYVRGAGRGCGHARNLGWREARGRVVLFTDDDCVPSPGWAAALARPLLAGEADLVQGRTLPRPDQLDREGPWSRTLRIEHESGYYQTANIGYRRDVLEQLGGFKADLARSGEDTELAWRAREHGYRTAFEPDALVHHAVWPGSFSAYLRDRARWADVVKVLRDHPGVMALAWRPGIYRRGHARFLAITGALGLVALLHPAAPLAVVAAGSAVHIVRTRRSGRSPLRRLGEMVGRFIADGYETAVIVRAGIRHRVLVV